MGTFSISNVFAPLVGKMLPDARKEIDDAKAGLQQAQSAVEAYAVTTVSLQTISTFAMVGMFLLALNQAKRS